MNVHLSRARHAQRARVALLAATAITLVLYAVPYGNYVLYPLMLLSTFVHEMGHGLTAVVLGGEFRFFKMWPDGSGVAAYAGHFSAPARATTAAGGLLGPALVAAGLFMLGRRAHMARTTLFVLAIICALAAVLVVRNWFGLAFVGVFACICWLIAQKTQPGTSQFTVVFLAIQLCASVFSRGDYLFTRFANTSGGLMPSDTQAMSDALIGPYWFWGGVVAAISLGVLAMGLRSFFAALSVDSSGL